MFKVLFAALLAIVTAVTVYSVVSPVFTQTSAAFENALSHVGEYPNGKLASQR